MWKLEIKTSGFDKVAFVFDDLKQLSEFAEIAVNHCDTSVVCKFKKMEEEEDVEII